MNNRSIQSVLLGVWTLFFPRWETRMVTVKAVGEGRKIVCASGPFFPVFSDIPCQWVEFEEYPEDRFTTWRGDLLPGMNIEVQVAVTSDGDILSVEV